jgi:tRNA pseudouridine65 synthase/23S rRNA pseudouridine1911/1915/1917 synthase
LNNQNVEGGRYLKNGDCITLIDLEKTPPKTYQLKLKVIYEDDDLAVVVKPAGINVSGNQFKTIQNALSFNLKPSLSPDTLPWALPVHRLDNQTSGLLLVAKSKTARVILGQAFEQKSIKKTYQAIVIGQPYASLGLIDSKINNKEAITAFKILKQVNSLKSQILSLLELYPKTGRTHQIRIHCAQLGCPILGDKLYGEEGMILKNKGLFLCAVGLQFKHPISKKELVFSIPTPYKFIKRLENEQRRFNTNSIK